MNNDAAALTLASFKRSHLVFVFSLPNLQTRPKLCVVALCLPAKTIYLAVVGWYEDAGETCSAGRPTIWVIVGQGLIALAVGAGGFVWKFFLSSIISLFFLPLWETARYRLKYCLKGPLNTTTNNQHLSFQTMRQPKFLDLPLSLSVSIPI